MKVIQDLANLISVRNYLISAPDVSTFKMDRDQIREAQKFVRAIDEKIIECVMATPNLDGVGKEVVRSFTRESTEDTEAVIKKFQSLEGKLPEGASLTTDKPQPVSKEVLQAIAQGSEGVSVPVAQTVSQNKASKPAKTRNSFRRTASEE